jgi:hypothetical protein
MICSKAIIQLLIEGFLFYQNLIVFFYFVGFFGNGIMGFGYNYLVSF